MTSLTLRVATIVVVVGVLVGAGASVAHAYEWTRPLTVGASGPDVLELQIRVSGWFSRADQTHLSLDGDFGPRTERAVRRFQKKYRLNPDGVAGKGTFKVLNSLERPNGSTKHFAWNEFKQKRNTRCSAEANSYAGTFKGGKVPKRKVKENVRRLMWRLEALRRRNKNQPIGINSGFRSVAYNRCIGGASLSQHLYGTAADIRVANTDNEVVRNKAKRNQLSGIGCYSQYSHNHVDLRVENAALPEARYWWWPKQDKHGHDVDSYGKPCWGSKAAKGARTTALVMRAVAAAVPGAGSLLPSAAEIEAFAEAVESPYDGHAD